MPRRWALTAVLLTAVIAATLLLASSPNTTSARWHSSVSVSFDDAVSDGFTSAAADLPSPRGAVSNTPAFAVTNNSERHRGWVNLQGVTVRAGSLGGQALAGDLGLRYTVTPPGGTCSGPASTYWNARDRGTITLGTNYTRPVDRVAGAVLAPGQSDQLCLGFFFNQSNRDFLLKNAGRDLIARSTVAIRSETPATWDSGADPIDSRYLVNFPPATPWDNNFGNISNSCRDRNNRVDLRWAWPDPDQQQQTDSPAVNAWELWTRPAGAGAEAWRKLDEVAGRERTIDIRRRDLDEGQYEAKMIARLDPGRNYWVESTQVLSLSFDSRERPDCDAVRVNNVPNPGGPVVLP